MKFLKITNNGLLDIRLLSLMGGTTKANDSFKIGQWGSGLKYSMAYLLRNNLTFRVFIGEQEVKISTEVENIRDEDFEIIYVNGEKTSVTTNMGGDAWKPWMIVREIWCNALDEGGHGKEITTDAVGIEGKTTFYIQLTPEFKEVYDNWNDYFIHSLEHLHQDGVYSIYPPSEKGKLYKQGVLIKTENQPTVFRYDSQNASLNELREFNGGTGSFIQNAIKNLPSYLCRKFFENVTDQHYESKMFWSEWMEMSNNWSTCLGEKKLIHGGIIAAYLLSGRGMKNLANTIQVPSDIYNFFVKKFPNLGVTEVTEKGEFVQAENIVLKNKVDGVIEMLIDCGYHMASGVTIVYGSFDKKETVAQADVKSRRIMLSESLTDKTTHYIASTIIEENEHIITGFSDETRAFQQHFIDLYTKVLLESNGINV